MLESLSPVLASTVAQPWTLLICPGYQDWNGAGHSRFTAVALLVWIKLLFMPVQRLLDGF